jgi:hypothetical protein
MLHSRPVINNFMENIKMASLFNSRIQAIMADSDGAFKEGFNPIAATNDPVAKLAVLSLEHILADTKGITNAKLVEYAIEKLAEKRDAQKAPTSKISAYINGTPQSNFEWNKGILERFQVNACSRDEKFAKTARTKLICAALGVSPTKLETAGPKATDELFKNAQAAAKSKVL